MPIALRGEETFSDALRWQELAKEIKVRLPLWRMPITTGGMRRFLKKVNVPVETYLADNNERTLKVFGQNNPDWPLRAWAGLVLENLTWQPFTGVARYQEEEVDVRNQPSGNADVPTSTATATKHPRPDRKPATNRVKRKS